MVYVKLGLGLIDFVRLSMNKSGGALIVSKLLSLFRRFAMYSARAFVIVLDVGTLSV